MAEASPAFTTLKLGSAYGPVYRQVSTAPPRESCPDEVPVIDLSDIYGDLSVRCRLAEKIRAAAEGTGFFYVKNHGISHEVIENARGQALA
jgi:non-haem dioxygenase in morphine synthesis N-terminal